MPGETATARAESQPNGRVTRKKSSAVLAFTPNAAMPSQAMIAMTWIQIVAAVSFWVLSPSAILPGPVELAKALQKLWFEDALGREILTSLILNVEAMAIAAVISLLLAYASTMPFFRPLVRFIANFRFLGLAGLSLIFTVYTSGSHSLKVSILVFSVSVYYLTSLVRIIVAIPESEKDYFRTLGMSEWQVVYATVIRGRAAEMWEALRQNSAMAWMMLTTVEGLSKSEGGVGVLMLLSQRLRRLDEVYAVQLTLWCLGLTQDYLFARSRLALFPWADQRMKGGK